jgi:hypothetical protein
MEIVRYSETSVDFKQTTPRYIPEDYSRRSDNLKQFPSSGIGIALNDVITHVREAV